VKRIARAATFAALALCFSFPVAAQKHVPTLDESLSLKAIHGASISPDGKYIAYTVGETDWKENAYTNQIWLMNVATKTSIQLTRGKKGAGGGSWSPDGRWLAFSTERESSDVPPSPPGKSDDKAEKPASTQIWLISPTGGEAWQLTEHPTAPGGFRWSHDGRQIAFTSSTPESKADKDRKEKYGDYQVIEKDYSQSQLWVVDVTAAEKNSQPVKARQLTYDASMTVGGFDWSPDSNLIAFSASPNPSVVSSYGDSDLYVVDLAHDNTVHKVVAMPGPDSSPMFSPDGKQLLFSTALAQPYFFYANSHLAVVSVDQVLSHTATSPADVQDLTAKFDEDPHAIDWAPDGIYFGAGQKTYSHLFRLNPNTKEITRISNPDNYNVDGVSFTKDFQTMVIESEDPTHLGELYLTSVSQFAPQKLTDMTAQIKDWIIGRPEVISWKSTDGATIEGILTKPADYDPSKKYPLLVIIHGGPTGTSRAEVAAGDSYYPQEIFLSKGALILEPNYRGSAGYGAAFRKLNVRNLGVGDMWDVMSGVDYLIGKGMVDSTRMGSMGWSEGGYISAFLTTHTDRFKAISVGAGISDWMTYYVNTDITPFTRQYLLANPWDDPAIYAKTSPITTIKQAKTPTLIQQGSNDARVPVPDSFELYRGLLDQHVPARLVLFSGYGHGITRPKSNRAVLQGNLDWFSHYIWGEPFPKDSALWGTSELNESN
jgi:dipeptidyl aminopeptidase/acylaminoacyl peptidase